MLHNKYQDSNVILARKGFRISCFVVECGGLSEQAAVRIQAGGGMVCGFFYCIQMHLARCLLVVRNGFLQLVCILKKTHTRADHRNEWSKLMRI